MRPRIRKTVGPRGGPRPLNGDRTHPRATARVTGSSRPQDGGGLRTMRFTCSTLPAFQRIFGATPPGKLAQIVSCSPPFVLCGENFGAISGKCTKHVRLMCEGKKPTPSPGWLQPTRQGSNGTSQLSTEVGTLSRWQKFGGSSDGGQFPGGAK